jgi:Armadillo/beta-catenin-like repeat
VAGRQTNQDRDWKVLVRAESKLHQTTMSAGESNPVVMGEEIRAEMTAEQASFEALKSTFRAAMDVKNALALTSAPITPHDAPADSMVEEPASLGLGTAPECVTGDVPVVRADAAVGLGDIPRLVELLRSGEEHEISEALSALRTLLSPEDSSPPIGPVVEAGMVEALVALLTNASPKIVIGALWALTTISDDHDPRHSLSQKVAKSGAIPIAVDLLDHRHLAVKEGAAYLLGNISNINSVDCRDVVLAAGALPGLSRNLNQDASLSFVRHASSTISNCLRTQPRVGPEVFAEAMPTVAKLLFSDDAGACITFPPLVCIPLPLFRAISFLLRVVFQTFCTTCYGPCAATLTRTRVTSFRLA